MVLRLRQVAFVANELEPVLEAITDVLGIEICYRDPGVAKYGLVNGLMPVGNELIEVVAPFEENTAGGRYLERRGGDGGYMLIFQCDNQAHRRARMEEMGVRLVSLLDWHDYAGMQVHPKDSGGTFLEIDQPLAPGGLEPDGPWHPAGPDWQRARHLDRVTAIVGAEIQADHPQTLAARWADLLEMPLGEVAGDPALSVDNATIRFVPCTDGRPEGLASIDIAAADPAAVLEAAGARGLESHGRTITLCGVRIHVLGE